MSAEFHLQLVASLPHLRKQAIAMTRNTSSAEDLVQDVACNALAAEAGYRNEGNFEAWISRILRNRFISNLRQRRDTTSLDTLAEIMFMAPAPHDHRVALIEVSAAIDDLPAEQRDALLMVVKHGMSYGDLAAHCDCAIGTAKSRVFRARRQLAAHFPYGRPRQARLSLSQADYQRGGGRRFAPGTGASISQIVAHRARRQDGLGGRCGSSDP